MKWKLIYRPSVVFVVSLLALGLSLYLYLFWFLRERSRLTEFFTEFRPQSSFQQHHETFFVIIVLSLLVAIIIAGLSIIFGHYQKSVRLYRAQENFLHGLSHEIKTPLSSLRLFLETFERYNLNDTQRKEYIGLMKNDVERLFDHSKRFLNAAAIESGAFKKENKKAVDLSEVIKECLELNPSWNNLGPSKVLFREPLSRILVKGDPDFLKTLVENLVTNGLKYNRSDKKFVSIFLYSKGQGIFLVVKDNGRGIPISERKRVFKKFYQLGQVKNMTASGSGIGLFLCQEICKLHRGQISIRSATNGGSIFIVKLPRYRSAV